MLLKIKAILGLAIIAAVGGFCAKLAGANYVEAFGPSTGAFASTAVGYAIKESLPRLTAYISKAFGVTVPPEDV